MDIAATLLSRLQFAFTISFHIIFPSLSIGLAAWLCVLEALRLRTGRQVYRTLFEFWLKIFSVVFGLGTVTGIVMGFQFGTNWSELSRISGPIQGPLLSYETFTAFYLEASFLGIVLFGRSRVPPWLYIRTRALHVNGLDFAWGGIRVPQWSRGLALGLERRILWRLASRGFHARCDGWSIGRGSCGQRWPLRGWRDELVDTFRSAVRTGSVSGLRASWGRLGAA